MQLKLIFIFSALFLGFAAKAQQEPWEKITQKQNITVFYNKKEIPDKVITELEKRKKIKIVFANPGKKYNDGSRKGNNTRRLFFVANIETYWILSYEHSTRGHHYHCLFIDTINNRLYIEGTNVKFESIEELKEYAKKEKFNITYPNTSECEF
jgi:hypothetical protein